MNKRNLGHWAILMSVIVVIIGAVSWMHVIDANDKKQVAISNQHHAEKTKDAITRYALKSQMDRRNKVTQYDRKNLGEKNPVFAAKLTKDLQAKKFVGSAIVVKNNHVVYQRAFGWANIKKQHKNKVTSQFLINSVQKSLTGALVMQAVEKGQIKLSDHLSKYYHIKHSSHVTIRQMLNMEGGISGKLVPGTILTEPAVYKYASQQAIIKKKQIKQFHYQPISYVLLAGILHKVTHQSYYQAFYQDMVTPLDLNHTGFNQIRKITPHMTLGYGGMEPGQYKEPHAPLKATTAVQVATGNVIMSTGDAFQAERAVIQGTTLDNPAGAQVLHQAGQARHYTGGLYHLDNIGYYSHGMGDDYESTVAMSKDGKSGVIFLSNNFVKKAMFPRWSTEQLAIQTFRDINGMKVVK
ncbi:serine hydrolase domain-containing protein [Levilactobacillus lindianensis]|uniref:serine hydrolase domain-containing protein n=1 Tax=Levilactobacillus lindianensis TaxID=2486018 RepID=UPI000F74BB96|nr:serine hydrolase domain-containing protein [Levilactobacillus lindianensis]